MTVAIPLAGAFGVQCVLILAAFTAVILVLTERQIAEFTDAIDQKIKLQQRNANQSILIPFMVREEPFLRSALKMAGRPQEMLINDNSTIASLMPFYEEGFLTVFTDDLISNFVQIARSDCIYHENGDLYWLMASISEDYWLTLVKNGTGDYSVQIDYPLNITRPPPYRGQAVYDITYDPMVQLTGAQRPGWMRARAYNNSASGAQSFSISIVAPLRWGPKMTTKGVIVDGGGLVVTNLLFLTFDLVGVRAIVESQLLSSQTLGLLVDVLRGDVWVSTDAAIEPFGPRGVSWSLDNFPGRRQVAEYHAAATECPHTTCAFKTMERDDTILSIINIRTASTGLNLHLLQSTPRSHFFHTSEQQMVIGVVIGIASCAVVMALFVAIALLIHRPLSRLRAALGEAARMHNEEAALMSGDLSYFAEVQGIQNSFLAMNHRLSLARPFLPRALLVDTEDDASAEEVDEGEGEGEAVEKDAPTTIDVKSRTSGFGGDENGAHTSEVATTAGSSASSVRRVASTNKTRGSGVRFVSNGGIALTPAIRQQSLSNKRVGVLLINMRNFHAIASSLASSASTNDRFTAFVKQLCVLVESSAEAEKGIVDSFHGDRFTVTFNVARTLGNAGRSGALTATRLVRDLAKHSNTLLAESRLSMGLSVGKAIVGNFGSDTIKKLSVVGHVFSEVVIMERLARHIRQDCCFLEKCLEGVESVAYSVIVGSVCTTSPPEAAGMASSVPPRYEIVRSLAEQQLHAKTPTASKPSPPPRRGSTGSGPSNTKPRHRHAPSSPNTTNNKTVAFPSLATGDEWMYELDECKNTDPYRLLNEAMSAYLLSAATGGLDNNPTSLKSAKSADARAPTDEENIATAALRVQEWWADEQTRSQPLSSALLSSVLSAPAKKLLGFEGQAEARDLATCPLMLASRVPPVNLSNATNAPVEVCFSEASPVGAGATSLGWVPLDDAAAGDDDLVLSKRQLLWAVDRVCRLVMFSRVRSRSEGSDGVRRPRWAAIYDGTQMACGTLPPPAIGGAVDPT